MLGFGIEGANLAKIFAFVFAGFATTTIFTSLFALLANAAACAL